MKRTTQKAVFFAMASLAIVCICSSGCQKDDDDMSNVKKVTIQDDRAGTFHLYNLSTNNEIVGESGYVITGDELKFEFIPNKEYAHFDFQTSYSIKQGSKERNIDSPYISGADEDDIIVMKATCDKQSSDTTYHLSAIRTFKIRKPQYYSSLSYYLGISPDLQPFVTPEITYSDDAGNQHTQLLTDDLFEQPKSFEMDGTTYWGDYSWRKTIQYFKWGIDCGMSVRYIPKSDVALTKEAYEFDQGLSVTSGSSNGEGPNGELVFKTFQWISLSVTINIGADKTTDDGLIKKEFVQEYIDKLVSTPQHVKLHISEDGNITKIEE